METIVVIVLAYLAGSIPFAYLLARRRGVDLRRAGSGNVGATNVLRTSGAANAVLAMVLDALKGTLAVVVVQRATTDLATAVIAGLASIVGHVYPLWLGFRGGKGVATAAGVFAVLAPVAFAMSGAVFMAVAWGTRYISAASLSAAVTLAVSAAFVSVPLVGAAAIAAGVLIVHSHRANLTRLIAGRERRVGERIT